MTGAACQMWKGDTTMIHKKYVNVIPQCLPDGSIDPLMLIWEDERVFIIDRVLETSLVVSGQGGLALLFRCVIHGCERNLYLEQGKIGENAKKPIRWFVKERSGGVRPLRDRPPSA